MLRTEKHHETANVLGRRERDHRLLLGQEGMLQGFDIRAFGGGSVFEISAAE